MSITSTYLDNDYDQLADFLDSSGIFGSVTNSSSVITCKDSSNNTVLTVDFSGSNPIVTAYASALNSKSITCTNAQKPFYGYYCSKGIIIYIKGTTNYCFFILCTKTNSGNIAVIISSSGNASNFESASKSFYSVAWGDVSPIAVKGFTPHAANQTTIVNFTTDPVSNTVSYTPNAGFLHDGQNYSMQFGTLTMNNENYLTNGYWVIKDTGGE